MATQDHILMEVKGTKESFDNATQITLSSYMNLPFMVVENNDQFTEIYNSTESLGGTTELAEHETPSVNKLNEGFEVTLSDIRYGNAIEITENDQVKMKDGSTKVDTYLMRQRDRLLKSVKQKFVTTIHAPFNDAFAGATYLSPDGEPLIDGAHTWNTDGAATWSNLGATAALSATTVDAAVLQGGNFKDASGDPFPQTYTKILVKLGGSAANAAKKLFAKDIYPTTVGDVNIYKGEYTIVETPYLTSSTAWFMLDDSMEESPVYTGINKFPSMSEPKVQNNEAIRSNVTGYWKTGIRNQPFNLYGTPGA